MAIGDDDPILAVLIASSQQAEEIGARLLKRIRPVRMLCAGAAAALLGGVVGAYGGLYAAEKRFSAERAEWIEQQRDPRIAKLLASHEGQAAMRLAELRVAHLLLTCTGRRSWAVHDDYCVPATAEGRPDGFRVRDK